MRRARPAHVLVPDPLTQGLLGVAWAMIVWIAGVNWPAAAAALLAIPLVQVGVTDLRWRTVYTTVGVLGLVAAVVLSPTVHDANAWAGALGAVAAFGTVALVAVAGRVAYRGQPMGRGDLMIGTIVGAAAGPHAIGVLAAGLVLSGVHAAFLIVAGRSRTAAVPCGPGLCLAGLAVLVFR
jgi:prepilin signal peptidase PulO-like enzyme (type II secretory pathway)